MIKETIKNLKLELASLFVLSLFIAFVDVTLIYFLSNLITYLMSGQGISSLASNILEVAFSTETDLDLVRTLCFVLSALCLILFLAKTLNAYLSNYIVELVRYRMTHSLMLALSQRDVVYFERTHSSTIIKKLTIELDHFINEFIRLLIRSILGFLTVTLIVVYLVSMNFVLSILSILVISIFYGVIAGFTGIKIKKLGTERSILNQGRLQILSEFLLNFRYFYVTNFMTMPQKKMRSLMNRLTNVQTGRLFFSQLVPLSGEFLILMCFFFTVTYNIESFNPDTRLYMVTFFIGIFRMQPYLKESSMIFNPTHIINLLFKI